jgi:hypothetical protein
MSDSIVAQITANRKQTLKNISTTAGYSFTPALVEEQRIVRNINGKYPYMSIAMAPIEPETENNISEHTAIYYLVTFEALGNDDDSTGDEILYTNRNITADIIKAWMQDRTCGGFAEMTATTWYDSAIITDNNLNYYRAAVVFSVTALIDSSDPYKLG